MRIAKWILRLFLAIIVVVLTPYFSIGVCIAVFKATGVLADGSEMFFDLRTPSWSSLLIFLFGSAALLGACVYAHKRLR
jgi:hypothetical protein